MRLAPGNADAPRQTAARLLALGSLGTFLCWGSLPAGADVFHLNTGGQIEGELLEEDGARYKVLTVLGTVTLTVDAVVRVERKASPFEEYRQLKAQLVDTPAEQFRLATWCEETGLVRERRAHLRRVLELDPDYAPARRALGYVRVGDLWVEGRTAIVPAGARSQPVDSAAEPVDDPAKLAAAIQGSWRLQIQGVKSMLLDSALAHQVEKGRRRILEIRDPLAVVPLVQVLSGGSLACRELLLEALSRFPEDVATVNLAAIALSDSNREIRRGAIASLVRRQDPRVTAQFRKALESDDDVLIRRAAQALAAVRAVEAVPELIEALTARRWKRVEVRMGSFFGRLPMAFAPGYTQVGSVLVPLDPLVGVPWPVAPAPLPRGPVQEVTVYRTEVLEALREISGEDFGFDQLAWTRWYEEHRS